jgi:hypothetical protein
MEDAATILYVVNCVIFRVLLISGDDASKKLKYLVAKEIVWRYASYYYNH